MSQQRPYIIPEDFAKIQQEKDSAEIAQRSGIARDIIGGRGIAWPTLRYIGAILCYLAGWITLVAWTYSSYPKFTLLTLGLGLIVTGILMGWTNE